MTKASRTFRRIDSNLKLFYVTDKRITISEHPDDQENRSMGRELYFPARQPSIALEASGAGRPRMPSERLGRGREGGGILVDASRGANHRSRRSPLEGKEAEDLFRRRLPCRYLMQ